MAAPLGEIEVDGGTLRVTRALTVFSREIPEELADDARELQRALRRLNSARVALETEAD